MRLSCRIMFLSLIFIIEILTWTDGAAIGARRAIPQYTQDYVYEVPGQGAAFYGNTLAGSPVVVDSGDDFRYRQEELVFSPGSEDELRVRPDGTAVYTEVVVDDVKPPSHSNHQKRSSGAEEEQQVQQNPSDTSASANKPSTTSTEAPASSTSTSTTPKSDEEPKKSPEQEQSKDDSKQNKTEDNKKDKRGPTRSFDLPPMESELGDQELVDAFSNIEEKRKNRSPTATTSEVSPATNVAVSVEQPENPQFSTTTEASTVTTMKSSEKKKRENETPPPTPVVTTEAATKETTELPKIPAVVATEIIIAPALSPLSMLKVDIPHQAVLVTEVESLESEEETTKQPERKREVQPETVFTTTTEPPMTSTVQEVVTTTTTTVSTTTTIETEAPTVTPKVAVRSVTATEAPVTLEVFKKDILVESLVTMKTNDKEEKFLPEKRDAAESIEDTTKVLQIKAESTTTQATVEETSKQPSAPSLSVLVVPVITQEKQEEKVSDETKISPQDEKGEMQNAKRSVQPETSTAKLQVEIDLQEESDERAPGSDTTASDKEKDAIIQINTRSSNVAPAESKIAADNAKEVFKAAVQTTKEIIDPASPTSEEREENARASSQAEVKGGEGFKRNIPATELVSVSKSIVVPLEEKAQSPAVSIAKQTTDSNKPQNEGVVANTVSKQETSEIGTELAPVVVIKRGIDSDEDDESEENAPASSPIHAEDNTQHNAPASQLETLPGRAVVVAKQVVNEEITDTTTITPAASVKIDDQEKKASSVNTIENRKNDISAPPKMAVATQVTESEEEEEESEEKPGEAGAKVTNMSLKEVAPGNSVNQSVSAAASKVETDEEEDSDETEQETPASSIATATSATTAIDKKQNNEDEENAPASSIDNTSKGPGKLVDSGESETDSKQTESEEEENEGSAPGTNVEVSTTTSTSVDTPAKQTEKDEDEEGSDSEESEETKHVDKREGTKELVPVITIVEGGTTKDGGSSAKDVKKEGEAESGEDADTSKEKGQQDSEEETETAVAKKEKSEESEEPKGDGDETADDDDDKRNPPGAAFRLPHGRHSSSHGHGHGRRRRRDSSGDDYYYIDTEAAIPRDYYQVYHRRYKRSPDISNIREVIVDGKKVYLDVPEAVPADNPHPRSSPIIMQNNDDPEAVRKTRQTVNELLSISTPKVARFPPAFCELERDSGILCPGVRRGIFLEQFYYDSGSNRCSHFVYNGCGGNANRFSTLWECTQFCGKKPQSEHSKIT